MATTAWVCLLKCMTYECLLPEMSGNRCWYTSSPVSLHKIIVKKVLCVSSFALTEARCIRWFQWKSAYSICISQGNSMPGLVFANAWFYSLQPDHWSLPWVACNFICTHFFWIHCNVRHTWCIQHWNWKSMEHRMFDCTYESRFLMVFVFCCSI